MLLLKHRILLLEFGDSLLKLIYTFLEIGDNFLSSFSHCV